MKAKWFAGLLLGMVGAVAGWQYHLRTQAPDGSLTLYGNVDIRQVDLAFNAEGQVLHLLKEEGDPVRAGEVIASLDPATYETLVRLVRGRLEAERAALAQLEAGSRPEEIERARAQVQADRAALTHAQAVFDRRRDLVGQGVVARQAYDDAKVELDVGRNRLTASEQNLRLAELGPRVEQIAQARAQVRAEEAALALAEQRLSYTQMKAPADGVILARVVEPGTIVLPTGTIYTLALTGQVWVRSFVPQLQLDKTRPGRTVTLLTDARPGRTYKGQIGFVSPTAEFTPKTVETPELRTQLVYRLRVHVIDPDDGLRQGMPVSILLAPE